MMQVKLLIRSNMMILVGNRRKREYLSMEKVYVVEEFNDERTTKEVKAIFKDKEKAEEWEL